MSVIATALVCGFMGLGSPSFDYVDDEKNCAVLTSAPFPTMERCMTTGRSGLDLYLIMTNPLPQNLVVSNYTCTPPDPDTDL